MCRPKVLASLTLKYDREVLYDEIWNAPMTTVARRYGVSDVALRKNCVNLWVPIPPIGYWAKVAANKPVSPRPMLPAVELVREFPRRRGKVHSPEEKEGLFKEIERSVLRGSTITAACRQAEIDDETFIRWRKAIDAQKQKGRMDSR
jgi:hypothetical protein